MPQQIIGIMQWRKQYTEQMHQLLHWTSECHFPR